MTIEETSIWLLTAIGSGVWVLVGLLVLRLFFLGKNSQHMLGVLLAVGLCGSSYGQTVSTSFSQSNIAAAWTEISASGFTVAPSGIQWWRQNSPARTSPGSGAFNLSRNTLNVTCPSAANGVCYLKGDAPYPIPLTVKVNGITTSTVQIAQYSGGWTAVSFSVPSGASTVSFVNDEGFTVYIDDLSFTLVALPIGSFQLSVTESVEIRPGEYAEVTVSTASQNWNGPNSIPVQFSPEDGLSYSADPLMVPNNGSAIMNVTNTGGTTQTLRTVEVTSTVNDAGRSYTAFPRSLSVIRLPPRSYTLTNSFAFNAQIAEVELGWGQSTTFDVWANSDDWIAGPLAVSITGLPVGWSYAASSLIPVNIGNGSSVRSTVTITAPLDAVVAETEFELTASGGGQVASFSIPLKSTGAVCDGVRAYVFTNGQWVLGDESGNCGDGCQWCMDEINQACATATPGQNAYAACVVAGNSCSDSTLVPCEDEPDDPDPDPVGACECSGQQRWIPNPDYFPGAGGGLTPTHLPSGGCGASCGPSPYPDLLPGMGNGIVYTPCGSPDPDECDGETQCGENECECPSITGVCNWISSSGMGGGSWACDYGSPLPELPEGCSWPTPTDHVEGVDIQTVTASGCYACSGGRECENQAGVEGSGRYKMIEKDGGFVWQWEGYSTTGPAPDGYVYGVKPGCTPPCGAVDDLFSAPIGLYLPGDVPGLAEELVAEECEDGECIALPDMLAELQEVMDEKGFDVAFTEFSSGASPLSVAFNLPCSLDGSCFFPVAFEMSCAQADAFVGFTPSGPRSVGLLCYCVSLLIIFFKIQLGWFFVRTFVSDLGSL
jgi:hypothetical protein